MTLCEEVINSSWLFLLFEASSSSALILSPSLFFLISSLKLEVHALRVAQRVQVPCDSIVHGGRATHEDHHIICWSWAVVFDHLCSHKADSLCPALWRLRPNGKSKKVRYKENRGLRGNMNHMFWREKRERERENSCYVVEDIIDLEFLWVLLSKLF